VKLLSLSLLALRTKAVVVVVVVVVVISNNDPEFSSFLRLCP
jgi:hypothetical protein